METVSLTEYAITQQRLAEAKERVAELAGQDVIQLIREMISHVQNAQRVFPDVPEIGRQLERLRTLYFNKKHAADPTSFEIN